MLALRPSGGSEVFRAIEWESGSGGLEIQRKLQSKGRLGLRPVNRFAGFHIRLHVGCRDYPKKDQQGPAKSLKDPLNQARAGIAPNERGRCEYDGEENDVRKKAPGGSGREYGQVSATRAPKRGQRASHLFGVSGSRGGRGPDCLKASSSRRRGCWPACWSASGNRARNIHRQTPPAAIWEKQSQAVRERCERRGAKC